MEIQGVKALTDEELLAVFLRVGVKGQSAVDLGRTLLEEHGGLMALGGLGLTQLTCHRGLGIAKAAQLVASFELGARVPGKWSFGDWIVRGLLRYLFPEWTSPI